MNALRQNRSSFPWTICAAAAMLSVTPMAAQSLEFELGLGYQPQFRSDTHYRYMRDTEFDVSGNGDIVAGRTPTNTTATGRRSAPLALFYVHEFKKLALRAGYRRVFHNFEGQMGNEDLSLGNIAGVNFFSSGRIEMQNYRISQQDIHLGLRFLELPGKIELEPFVSQHFFSESHSRFAFYSTLLSGTSVATFGNATTESERRFRGYAPGVIVRIPVSGSRNDHDRILLVAEYRSMATVTIRSPTQIDRGAAATTSGSIANSVFSLSASANQYDARLALREFAFGVEFEGAGANWRLQYREQRYSRSYPNFITLFSFTGLRGPAPIGTQTASILLPTADVSGDFSVYGRDQRETLAGIEAGVTIQFDLK